ncbi:MAG: hypothetical protein RIC81_05625 [Microcella pacifica]|uniref:glycosyltransferase n=1 Tax=Microcella pacifica TaxID=2591847 RepID=UPI0033151AC5
MTTVGYGSAPNDAIEHIEVPSNLPSLPQTVPGVSMLATRQWRRAEMAAPAVRFVRDVLREKRFDLVVANDARVLALAHAVAQGAPVWADLHEWAPEERTHVLSWRLLVAPFMRHLCARYLPLCAATSTVCEPIAELYDRDFGVHPVVVRNAGPWQSLEPSPIDDDRVRLVHSGGAVGGRNLEAMIDAVAALDERFTLDLYLLPANDGGAYLRKLTSRAAGIDRIVFHPPVAPSDLPATLNDYDVGVFWIPPTHTNARLTLPNKFFDYVQARLAVAVGPTVEMQRLVEHHGLGIVADGFTVEQCVASLASLTANEVRGFKSAAHSATHDLSFESDAQVIRSLVRASLSTEGA